MMESFILKKDDITRDMSPKRFYLQNGVHISLNVKKDWVLHQFQALPKRGNWTYFDSSPSENSTILNIIGIL